MKTSAAAGTAAALAPASAYGANDRIRVGVIGTANRGGQLIDALAPHDDAEIAALCDVYKPAMEKRREELGGKPDLYGDYRRILERGDVDAVVIATPDHWHALQTVHACQAGKDVYVEKPLSETIYEGQKMIAAARKGDRVVQVGTHRRSSPLFMDLRERMKQDWIGKVTVARCYRLSNMYPDGIGKAPPSEPPEGLDWQMWLGPRPERDFQKTIAPYKFRWWQRYSSQIGNWGVHYFDLIRWMLDEDGPVSVSAHGGRYAVDDDRTIPDTMEATFELESGRLVIFGQYEANGHRMFPHGDIELRGTQGTIYADPNKVEVFPERGGQFQDRRPRMDHEVLTANGSNHELTVMHMRNFLDCIKSRKRPNADVEEGHKSTVFAHLGNIALGLRKRIAWDPVNQRAKEPEAVNDLLHYEYRPPWDLG